MAWLGKRGLRRALAALLLLSLCGVGGCLSRGAVQKQRYGIVLERDSQVTGPGHGILRVSIMRAAPAFERKAFIYRKSDLTWVSDFYNEFFSAPGVMLRENLLVWLDDAGIFEYVIAGGDAHPDWILESRIESLYGDGRDTEQLSTVAFLQFTLLDATKPRRPIVFQQGYQTRTPLGEKSPDAYARGVEAVLSEVFARLESDLRALVEERAASATPHPPGEGEAAGDQ
jgi:hypothetical protein